MQVSVEEIRILRERTGAGIMDCKRALQESGSNLDQAQEILKTLGLAVAAKKAARATHEGIIDIYLHAGGRVGAMVELNCETDFAARTPGLRELAHQIAMQVAAMDPTSLGDEDELAGEVDGNESDPLLQQRYIKDESKTVQDLITESIATVGENIRVRRFSRFEVGN